MAAAPPPPPYGQPAAPGYPPQQPGYPPQQPAPYPNQPPVVVVAAQPAVFGRQPMNMTCGNCNAQILTAIDYESGTLTWIICLPLFLVTGICCFIPFFIDGCKDVIHKCPNCKRMLGRKNALS